MYTGKCHTRKNPKENIVSTSISIKILKNQKPQIYMCKLKFKQMISKFVFKINQ